VASASGREFGATTHSSAQAIGREETIKYSIYYDNDQHATVNAEHVQQAVATFVHDFAPVQTIMAVIEVPQQQQVPE
jgi:hypothetical protein